MLAQGSRPPEFFWKPAARREMNQRCVRTSATTWRRTSLPATPWECRRSGWIGSIIAQKGFLRRGFLHCRIWSLYFAETSAWNRLLRHGQEDLYHRGHRGSQGKIEFSDSFLAAGLRSFSNLLCDPLCPLW